jgi:hypothetical protein
MLISRWLLLEHKVKPEDLIKRVLDFSDMQLDKVYVRRIAM